MNNDDYKLPPELKLRLYEAEQEVERSGAFSRPSWRKICFYGGCGFGAGLLSALPMFYWSGISVGIGMCAGMIAAAIAAFRQWRAK